MMEDFCSNEPFLIPQMIPLIRSDSSNDANKKWMTRKTADKT